MIAILNQPFDKFCEKIFLIEDMYEILPEELICRINYFPTFLL